MTTFCSSQLYGGVPHNCELISEVPDEEERRLAKKGAKGDARLVEERLEERLEERNQKLLFQMLLRPELSGN